MKIWRRYGTTALFLGLTICLTAAGFLLTEKGFSEMENRYLQKKPEFSWKALFDGSFGEAYEDYLGDQFPFRQSFVAARTGAERLLGREDVNGVYFGKDGYLLEKFDREDIETEQMEKNLDALAGFLTRQAGRLGADRVRAMLVPSASWILKEKLPFAAAPYDQGTVVRMLEKRLTAGSSFSGTEAYDGDAGTAFNLPADAMVVDVEQSLREHRLEEIYYRTDHHWTVLGAYYGYCAWAESMGFVPREKEEFAVETVSRNFLGTVQAKVGVGAEPDRMERWIPVDGTEWEAYYDRAEEPAGLYAESALESRDKYRFYLDGNHGLTEIRRVKAGGNGAGENGAGENSARENGAETSGRKLCIIRDSYANSFAPFAACHYDSVFLVDLRYFNGDLETFLEQEGITDILALYRIPGFAVENSVWKMGKRG